jgi:molybdate transport system regulatory protein
LYTTEHNETATAKRSVKAPGWSARPRWRLCRGSDIALGPGKADLLETILHTGTISGAARKLGMSYRRAWVLVETMNRCFTNPLVSTTSWRRQGASLTRDGWRVLRLYRQLESASLRAVKRPLAQLESLTRNKTAATLSRSGSRAGKARRK